MKKKVLIIGPCLTMGGMERASASMANGLSEMEISVHYLAIFKRSIFFRLNSAVVYHEPPGFLNSKKINIVKTIIWIRRVVKEINPDTILVYNKFYSAIVVLALLKTKFQVYISERSSPLYKWAFLIRIFNRLAFIIKPPAGIIAQTSVAKRYQEKYYSRSTRIKVIPNALPKIELKNIPKKNQILAVGRLNDYLKGFDRLFEAFSLINTDWKLAIAGGDINDNKNYKLQIENLGIMDRVIFLGKVEDLSRIYLESSIFAIPSRSEGFPNALAEAMAYGLPSVSFDFIAGPRDLIVDGKNGFIVPDGDILAFSKTLSRLINDSFLREDIGKRAADVSVKLSSSRIAKEVLSFILPNS